MEFTTREDLFGFLSTIEERITSVEQAQKSFFDDLKNSNNDNQQDEQPTKDEETDETNKNENNDNSDNNEEQNLDELAKLLGF